MSLWLQLVETNCQLGIPSRLGLTVGKNEAEHFKELRMLWGSSGETEAFLFVWSKGYCSHELGLYHGVLDDSRYELSASVELGSVFTSAGLVISCCA